WSDPTRLFHARIEPSSVAKMNSAGRVTPPASIRNWRGNGLATRRVGPASPPGPTSMTGPRCTPAGPYAVELPLSSLATRTKPAAVSVMPHGLTRWLSRFCARPGRSETRSTSRYAVPASAEQGSRRTSDAGARSCEGLWTNASPRGGVEGAHRVYASRAVLQHVRDGRLAAGQRSGTLLW